MKHVEYIKLSPDTGKLKLLTRVSWVLSIVVFSLVVMMGRYKLPISADLSFLPLVNAVLNSIVSVSLVVAFIAILNKSVVWHKRAIGVAVLCSVLFLLSYVAYHGTQQEVKYGGEGVMRTIYFIVLASHIIFAAVSLPFILITLSLGYTNHFQRHKKMARWVFPLWLYVATTGPVCYLMLKPYY